MPIFHKLVREKKTKGLQVSHFIPWHVVYTCTYMRDSKGWLWVADHVSEQQKLQGTDFLVPNH